MPRRRNRLPQIVMKGEELVVPPRHDPTVSKRPIRPRLLNFDEVPNDLLPVLLDRRAARDPDLGSIRIQSILEFLLLVLTLLERESSDLPKESAVRLVEDLELVLAACELGLPNESVEDRFLGLKLVELSSESSDFRGKLEISWRGELDLLLDVFVVRCCCSYVCGTLSEITCVRRVVEHPGTTESEFWIRRRGWRSQGGGGGKGVRASSIDPTRGGRGGGFEGREGFDAVGKRSLRSDSSRRA